MVDHVELRPARPDEAPALSELAMRSKGHWGYDEAFLEACRSALTVDPGDCDGERVIVAVRAGTLRGFYRLAGAPPVGELTDLFVDAPAIGTGLGRTLIEHARANAVRMGFEVLTLEADPGAVAFYLHAGAVRVGETPSGSIPGRMLPRMELQLSDGRYSATS